MKQKCSLFLLILPSLILSASAQISPEVIKKYTYSGEMKSIDIKHKTELEQFYIALGYYPCWIGTENKNNRDILLSLLKDAPWQGLNEEDYQYAFIRSFSSQTVLLNTTEDSLEAEMKFSNAAIHLFSDLFYGAEVHVLPQSSAA